MAMRELRAELAEFRRLHKFEVIDGQESNVKRGKPLGGSFRSPGATGPLGERRQLTLLS
jgi:hypothetical protein